MFHHPAGIAGAGSTHHLPTNATVLTNHQNENLIHVPSSNTNKNSLGGGGGVNKDGSNVDAKTPGNKGTSNRRRALGDISNKKLTRLGGIGGGGGATVFHSQKDAVKLRSSNLPSSSSTKEKSRTNNRHQVAPSPPRKATHVSFIPRLNNTTSKISSSKSSNTPALQRQTVIIPSTSSESPTVVGRARNEISSVIKPTVPAKALQQSTNAQTNTTLRPFVGFEEPVPEIELPAGRTWKQQLENDLLDEDDIASTSSIDSFHPKDRTMWDDWGESLWKHRLTQGRKEAEEEALEADRFVREQIQKMLEKDAEEEQKGLEQLYDVIDNLDFLGDASLVELDWSPPASSRCGEDELFYDELLIEL